MDILPCKDCITFICCKNRAVEGNYMFLSVLQNCELFNTWSGSWYLKNDKREVVNKCFEADVIVYGGDH